MGCTSVQPGEYGRTVHVRRRCGLFVDLLRPLCLSACHRVELHVERPGELKAVRLLEGDVMDNVYRYTSSLYWSVSLITTTGYGDIVPTTNVEKCRSRQLSVLASCLKLRLHDTAGCWTGCSTGWTTGCIACIARCGDWRHVATGCTALVDQIVSTQHKDLFARKLPGLRNLSYLDRLHKLLALGLETLEHRSLI